jgi:putative glycosyltransferase
MQLSVVTTLYRSEKHLGEFVRRMGAAAQKITPDYEIVLVNDGSPDDSQTAAEKLAESDAHISVIELSRNFGHHKAIMTGLGYARGDWVFLIDCDLEEEPELLEQFWAEAREHAADVVFGVQKKRKGGAIERITGAVFYWLINLLSTYPVPTNLVTVRLMRRDYVQSLVQHKDQELFLAGLWALTGFRQRPLEIVKHSLNPTTYTLGRKLWNTVNAITSFSTKPLVAVFLMGCVISFIAGAAAVYMIVLRFILGRMLEGWLSIMVSLWLLGGLTIFSLGIIGIYLSKIFTETKPRPYTVVRSTVGRRFSPQIVKDERHAV